MAKALRESRVEDIYANMTFTEFDPFLTPHIFSIRSPIYLLLELFQIINHGLFRGSHITGFEGVKYG